VSPVETPGSAGTGSWSEFWNLAPGADLNIIETFVKNSRIPACGMPRLKPLFVLTRATSSQPQTTMIRFAKTFAALISSAFFIPTALAVSTPGSVSLTATISDYVGKSGSTAHWTVAWITTGSGAFVKTVWLQGTKYAVTSTQWNTHCPQWWAAKENTANGGNNIVADGYTSATAANYSVGANNPIDPVWDCRDASNNLVPDGDYKLWIQYAEDSGAGPAFTTGLLWTKGPAVFSQTYPAQGATGSPTNGSNFTSPSIVWTPSTVAPTITSAAPPSTGEQGTSYSHTLAAAGSTPISYSVTAGALPPPLTLGTGGVISGTPNAPGLFTGTITAANGTLPNATQNFSITIAPAIVFTSAAPPVTGNVGTPYNHMVTASGSGTITYAVSSGALPTGLVLSPAGVISGTPETAGPFTGVIRASNGVATAVTQNFSISIGAAVANTPGTVTLTTTLASLGSGLDEYWSVAWLTKDDGTFIKTIDIRGNGLDFWDVHWNNHCTTWYSARAGSVALDGFTAATSTSYAAPLAASWNGRDASNNVMPDGAYKLWVQYAEDIDGTPGPVTTNGLTWTKGTSATTVNPVVPGGAFTNVSVIWTPTLSAYDSWAIAAGLGAGADPAATPKSDGVTNLQKYAFNLDASKPDVRRLVVGAGGLVGLPGTVTDAGPVLRMEFLRRKASTNPGITYTAQFGSDLIGWTAATGTPTSIDTTWERVVVIDTPPVGSTKRFGRVMVSQP
jgi:hypothetical protein